MINLVENEVLKIILKKRLYVIIGILVVLISLFAYGEQYTLNRTRDEVARRFGIENVDNWRKIIEQQLTDIERRLENPFIPDEGRASLRVRAEQLSFYLDRGVSPINSSAGRFMTRFLEQSIFLFLPLLIILLAGDIVSGESNTGTIKLLLTSPVQRWKILLSKFMALAILEVIVLLIIAFISFVVSVVLFRYVGFDEPVITGFRVVGDRLDTSSVITVPQWRYMIMIYSIGYFVSFVIGCISLMVSVLVKSTSASIGIMMSSLIGGSFLSFFISDWEFTRYIFTVNLNLTSFLSGSVQRIQGLTMAFSTYVLLAWALGSILISFLVFTRKDILA